MCSAIQENTQETTNLLVYKVWIRKRGGTGVFADLVLKRLWKAVVKTRLLGPQSSASNLSEQEEGYPFPPSPYLLGSVDIPGPIITVGESKALGNDMVPFFTHTGTRKSLLEESRAASHVEQRPLLGLTSLVL